MYISIIIKSINATGSNIFQIILIRTSVLYLGTIPRIVSIIIINNHIFRI